MHSPADLRLDNNHSHQWLPRTVLPFIVGGTSGIVATMCVQPVDMIKVQIQLAGKGADSRVLPMIRRLIAQKRVLDLYAGLSAGVLRQIVYGTSRLGFFFTFENAFKKREANGETTYGFKQRAVASIAAGALGATIGNPTEVALLRMQSDSLLPVSGRQNYRSGAHAMVRIVKEEGIRSLWAGTLPTVIRAMSTNFGQLAFFSESKAQLQKRTKLSQQSQTVVASAIAGFFASLLSLPFDFTKSRLQSQRRATSAPYAYQGMTDCFLGVLREEGPLRFYRGFGPYFLRMAPHRYCSLE